MKKSALVLRHVHFEDLGSFAAPLAAAGYDIRYSEVSDHDFCSGDPCAADLLVILGGPIGVYDTAYRFLPAEKNFIRGRLVAGRPTLGICLGAQLIAAALGERVAPTGLKEIGFSKLRLTGAGKASPLRHLEDVAVLHWHGDTYELPLGAVNLASSDMTEQQAFAIGPHVLGLQFHLEVETNAPFERWLVGHATELAVAKVDVSLLRQSAKELGPPLRQAAVRMLHEWLSGLDAAA